MPPTLSGHAAQQGNRAGQVRQGRHRDDDGNPAPLGRLNGVPAAADLGQLRQEVVERAGQGGDREQGAGPYPLDASQLLVRAAAGRGRRRPGVSQQPFLSGDGAAGRGRQGQRLQQRHRGPEFAGADAGGRAGHGPVRADQGGQGRHELGQVKLLLALRGGQLGEAEIGQPGLAALIDHHVGRTQGAVGDPGVVQQAHLGPQLPEKAVADLLGGELLERAAVDPFHDEQRRPVGGLDHPVDPGTADASTLRHHGDQGLMLDRLDQGGYGPRVADIAQPGEPVHAVEQVGVALV
jgi:hypothetical protein